MYSREAFIMFIMCFSILNYDSATGNLAGSENGKKFNYVDSKWPIKVIKCFEETQVLQCFSKLLDAKSKTTSLIHKISKVTNISISDGIPFSDVSVDAVTKVMNDWIKGLKVQVKNEFKSVTQQGLNFNLTKQNLKRLTNETALADLGEGKVSVEGRGKKMNFQNVIPFLLVPGLFLAGLMPWVLPPLKMVVMTVTMMNNMALTTSLVSLVRGYVFDTPPTEHIFYVNHGYLNEKKNKQKQYKRRSQSFIKHHR